MENRQKKSAVILAGAEVFDYLKEKVGERKTRTEAYCDLLDKSLAGFISPFLRKHSYELRPDECHVTVSDLAAEWHWHRATVRAFLDALEAFGLLKRTKLPKSIVIAMTVQSGGTAGAGNVQENPDLAMQLREVLYDWVIGKATAAEAGTACGQFVRRAMAEAGVQERPLSDVHISVSMASVNDDPRVVKIRATAMECIALAAMQRVLRKSRFDDILDFMDFFRLDLDGGWTSLIETSEELAELILGTEAHGAVVDMDDDEEPLKTFRKPFLALAARAREAACQVGD